MINIYYQIFLSLLAPMPGFQNDTTWPFQDTEVNSLVIYNSPSFDLLTPQLQPSLFEILSSYHQHPWPEIRSLSKIDVIPDQTSGNKIALANWFCFEIQSNFKGYQRMAFFFHLTLPTWLSNGTNFSHLQSSEITFFLNEFQEKWLHLPLIVLMSKAMLQVVQWLVFAPLFLLLSGQVRL